MTRSMFDRLADVARAVVHGEVCGLADEAHAALTLAGQWAEPCAAETEHDYANGTCRRCGYRATGRDFLAAIDRAREADPEAFSFGFIGPCVHGRNPWTRCEEGCDTEEQARGLEPPGSSELPFDHASECRIALESVLGPSRDRDIVDMVREVVALVKRTEPNL